MTKQTLFLALVSGFLVFTGCNNKKDSKTAQLDSSAVKTIDTTKLFFPTATTIALPEFVVKTDSCEIIREGFWREFEFVSKDQKSSIDKEFAKIQNIQDNYKHGDSDWGYTKVAVRDLISQPLSVDLSKLKSYFPDKNIELTGLGIKDQPGQVKNGFYFGVGGVYYYGLLDKGIVKTFGIYYSESDSEMAAATEYLSKLLSKEKLFLVDWNARKSYDEKTIISELVGY